MVIELSPTTLQAAVLKKFVNQTGISVSSATLICCWCAAEGGAVIGGVFAALRDIREFSGGGCRKEDVVTYSM